MRRFKNLISAVAFVLIFAFLFIGATNLFKDKRVSFDYDVTRKVKGFYNEPKNSLDFVFIGSSQMFSAVSPAVLWKEYGITSYDFGANEQPLWISYYYIKEALKYQTPLAVVLDIRYVYFEEEFAKEGVNRINIDDIHFSKNKIDMIQHAVPEEMRMSFYLEFMKYHNNWKNLNEPHFQSIEDLTNPYKGFTPFFYRREYPDEPAPEVSQTETKKEIPPKSLEYLQKIIALSKQEGFNLLLLKIPDSLPDGQMLYNTVSDIAKENDVPFINFNTIMSGENHLNIVRAEEFSIKLGEYLVEHYPVVDKRTDKSFDQWHQDIRYFYAQKDRFYLSQETELLDYLELLSNPNYSVFIAAKDEASQGMTPSLTQKFAELGLQTDWKNRARHGYIAVIDSGKMLYEKAEDAALQYTTVAGTQTVQIASAGYHTGNQASILIDGVEYAKNARGLNIVVYDKLLDAVVDTVAFDTYDLWQCTR